MKPSDNQNQQKNTHSREQDYHDLILSTIQTCESLSIKPTISMLVDFSGLSEEKILEIMENYYKKNSSTEKLKKLNDDNGTL
jgi:hypothetical protein